MPPEATATPDTPQPTLESPEPVVEAPAPTPEPVTSPAEASPTMTAPEASSASAEAVQVPEMAQGSLETPVDTQSPTQTAQTPPSEPMPSKPDPIQPPSAAAPVPTSILHTARDLLNKARVAIQDRKRKKRDKIMQALNKKNKITNDEVEKLLHVSDATAARYLSALAKEGRVKQIGKTGKGVVYKKI